MTLRQTSWGLEERITSVAVGGRDLHKHYGEGEGMVRAVDGVDINVARGEHVAIMGRSGCGKSTLLHVLGGLEHLTSGTLHLGGSRVDGFSETKWALLRRRRIGFVFQTFNLIDELTALENVELPALLAGFGTKAARQRARVLLGRVELTSRAGHLPAQLSGGQRQRVAIARALVNEPLVVFADEPTGNLDTAATNDILRLFADLRTSGQTLIMVTHDERVATTADRLLTMRDGAFVDETRLTDLPALGDHHPPSGGADFSAGPT
jgi:putative ABC transport system ATP-binding protein